MWNLWTAHVPRRLLGRLRRMGAAGVTGVRPRVVRQDPPPLPSPTGLPEVPHTPHASAGTADDERASSR